MNDLRNNQKRGDSGNIFVGVIIVGVGSLFLLINLDVLPEMDKTWPGFIIIVGLAFIFSSFFSRFKGNGD